MRAAASTARDPGPSLGASFRAVLAVMEMTWKNLFSDAFIIFTVFVQPLLVSLMGLWMLQDKGAQYGIYVVVGSGMSGVWSSLLFVSGNGINTERWQGTLETLAGTPTPLRLIVFAKNLANVAQSLLSMAAAYLLASAVLGYPLTVAHPGLFLASLVLSSLALVSFGLVVAPIFMINPAVQQWQNAFEFPVYVVSGFLFPILMLPFWTRPISWIFPTYWAARALHAASGVGASGPGAPAGSGEFILCWSILVVEAMAYVAVSELLFRVMLRKAKRDATLDLE